MRKRHGCKIILYWWVIYEISSEVKTDNSMLKITKWPGQSVVKLNLISLQIGLCKRKMEEIINNVVILVIISVTRTKSCYSTPARSQLSKRRIKLSFSRGFSNRLPIILEVFRTFSNFSLRREKRRDKKRNRTIKMLLFRVLVMKSNKINNRTFSI